MFKVVALVIGGAYAQLKPLPILDKDKDSIKKPTPNEFQTDDELTVRVSNYLMPLEQLVDPFSKQADTLLIPYSQFNWCDVPNQEGHRETGVQYRFKVPEFEAFQDKAEIDQTSLCSLVWLPDSI